MFWIENEGLKSICIFVQILIEHTKVSVFLIKFITALYNLGGKVKSFPACKAWASLVQINLFVNYHFFLCCGPVGALIIPAPPDCPVWLFKTYTVTDNIDFLFEVSNLAKAH